MNYINIFDIDKKEFDESHGLFMQLVDEKDRELVLSTNQHIRETGKPFNIQYCVVTKSGEKRFIEEHGYAERDSRSFSSTNCINNPCDSSNSFLSMSNMLYNSSDQATLLLRRSKFQFPIFA